MRACTARDARHGAADSNHGVVGTLDISSPAVGGGRDGRFRGARAMRRIAPPPNTGQPPRAADAVGDDSEISEISEISEMSRRSEGPCRGGAGSLNRALCPGPARGRGAGASWCRRYVLTRFYCVLLCKSCDGEGGGGESGRGGWICMQVMCFYFIFTVMATGTAWPHRPRPVFRGCSLPYHALPHPHCLPLPLHLPPIQPLLSPCP